MGGLHVCNCTHTVQYMYYVTTITKPPHHVCIPHLPPTSIYKHIRRYMIDTRPQNLLQPLLLWYRLPSTPVYNSLQKWLRTPQVIYRHLNIEWQYMQGQRPDAFTNFFTHFAFSQCIAIFSLEKLLLSQLPTSIPTSLKLCQLGITMVIIITFELGTSYQYSYKPPQLGQYWRLHNYALPSFEVPTSNQSQHLG